MSEKDVILDQSLQELYYDPVSGYQSQAKLYSDARLEGLPVSKAKVKSWFEQQKTYTRFRASKRGFERRQTYISSIGKQLQMDVVDMSKFEAQNDGYRWIFALIDVFSRFAFCTPVRHKAFMEPAVERILKSTKNVLVSSLTLCIFTTEVSLGTKKFYHFSNHMV